MPETCLFIWYHAGLELEPELHRWLSTVEQQLGYRGTLYRRHEPLRTTYMEIYQGVDAEAESRIEALAAKQSWVHEALESPRHCEVFTPVSPDVKD